VRRVGGVKAVVAVTSDKCYENREWIYPYRENDAMGGHDPYSSSKGCAELVVSAYRNSYFAPDAIGVHGTAVATVRAGNVIGGGDWSEDRLVPDLVRAFEKGEFPVIRSPGSVRTWQHVLEALAGYLALGERLMRGEAAFAGAWNFGPSEEGAQPVAGIVAQMAESWGVTSSWHDWDGPIPHEAALLRLDCSKARSELGWRPTLSLDEAIDLIVHWHKEVGNGGDARNVTLNQINLFLSRFDGKLKQAA
jgi:CDP-glucose 4,6-dehydratase